MDPALRAFPCLVLLLLTYMQNPCRAHQLGHPHIRRTELPLNGTAAQQNYKNITSRTHDASTTPETRVPNTKGVSL